VILITPEKVSRRHWKIRNMIGRRKRKKKRKEERCLRIYFSSGDHPDFPVNQDL
jgi:hypothetical protein